MLLFVVQNKLVQIEAIVYFDVPEKRYSILTSAKGKYLPARYVIQRGGMAWQKNERFCRLIKMSAR